MSSRVENKMTMNKMATNKDKKPMIIMYRGNTIDGWLSAYLFFSKYSNSRIVKLWAFDPYNAITYPSASYVINYDLYFVNGCIQNERLQKWVDEHNIRICKYFDNHSDVVDKIELIHRSNENGTECIIENNENGVLCTSYWDKYVSYDINSSTFKLVYLYLYNSSEKDSPSWISILDRIIMWKHLSVEEKAIHELFHSMAIEYNKENVGKGLKNTKKVIEQLFEEKSSNKNQILSKYKDIIVEKQNIIHELLKNNENNGNNKNQIIKLTDSHINEWKLPLEWTDMSVFVMDTTNIVLDSTLAADFVFDKYNNDAGSDNVNMFINYRIIRAKNNKKYVQYSCRAFKENGDAGNDDINNKYINLLNWKLVKGFPLSAGGKYEICENDNNLPFVF